MSFGEKGKKGGVKGGVSLEEEIDTSFDRQKTE